MTELVLNAQPRTETGRRRVRRLRKTGYIPAVLYGPGVEPRNLQVRAQDVERLLRRGATTQLVDLFIDGEKEPHKVLIREVQRHPIRRDLLHVDFFQVSLREKIEVEVPIVLVGHSPAVEAGLGTVNQVLDTIALRCLPTDIPAHIEVDLTQLTADHDVIRAGELPLPERVELAEDPEAPVVVLEYITEEAAEEEKAAAEEGAEPEVIARGKGEEEEEEE